MTPLAGLERASNCVPWPGKANCDVESPGQTATEAGPPDHPPSLPLLKSPYMLWLDSHASVFCTGSRPAAVWRSKRGGPWLDPSIGTGSQCLHEGASSVVINALCSWSSGLADALGWSPPCLSLELVWSWAIWNIVELRLKRLSGLRSGA